MGEITSRAFEEIWITSLTLLLLVAPARAQQGGPGYADPGVYVWLGGATGIDMAVEDAAKKELGTSLPAGTGIDVKSAVGFGARLGARTTPHLAAEVQVEYLPSFDWDVTMGSSSVTAIEMRVLTLTGNVKLYVLTGRIQPFALVGGGGAFAKATSPLVSGSGSASSFALRGGGGVDFYLTEQIAVSADVSYLLPTGDNKDLDYLSIGWGLQYRF